MAQVSEARVLARAVLGDVRRRQAHARDLLRTTERLQGRDPRTRAQVTRLVLGVVGARGFLDALIDGHARRAARIEPQVRDALRLSSYELLFLSTPAPVAVSQGVELVRGLRPRAAGMANAVLHRVADQDAPSCAQSLGRVRDGNFSLHDLEMVSGYPSWLLARVSAERGTAAARDMALSAREPAPVYVAANRALLGADEACARLEDAGLAPHALDDEGAFVLGSPAGLTASGFVETAEAVVADFSVMRIVGACGICPGMRVLEVGQGRGTKSVLMQNAAVMAGGPAQIVGVDSSAYKVEVAQRRMERAGLSDWVRCRRYDARSLGEGDIPEELRGPFDLVFVDAPCSGTGTLRRHPEIAWDLTPEDVDALAALQARILSAAATRVRPGGTLTYSTCSVLKQENEDVVEGLGLTGKVFQSLPAPGGPDGHFCSTVRVGA